MSVFTSRRERRLWLWALAVMVAIYATLGPARTVVDALRERGVLELSVTILALAVAAAIIWQWRKSRPGWSEMGVALGVALAYWMAFLRIENPAERTHLIEYGVLAALIHQALLERARQGRHVPKPAALTVAVTAILGLIDETIQLFIPSRFFDWNDVFFNALAGFMVVAARLALAPVRLPGWRLWFLWVMAGAIGWGWSLDPGAFGQEVRVEPLWNLPFPRYPGLIAGAAVTGVLQAWVYRRYGDGWLLWAGATVAAALACGGVLLALRPIDPALALGAAVSAFGAAAGTLQWLVLRSQVRRAGWWVAVSTSGWLICIPWSDYAGPPGWAIYGVVTGAALAWLLRRERRGVEPEPRLTAGGTRLSQTADP